MNTLSRLGFAVVSAALVLTTGSTFASAATPTIRQLQEQANITRKNGSDHQLDQSTAPKPPVVTASLTTDSPLTDPTPSILKELVEKGKVNRSGRN
jgi:hypothetical protein